MVMLPDILLSYKIHLDIFHSTKLLSNLYLYAAYHSAPPPSSSIHHFSFLLANNASFKCSWVRCYMIDISFTKCTMYKIYLALFRSHLSLNIYELKLSTFLPFSHFIDSRIFCVNSTSFRPISLKTKQKSAAGKLIELMLIYTICSINISGTG